MKKTLRGADIVAQTLERLDCDRIFTLSGNHIMSIFDAVLETKIELVHVRHEAAAVHMADGWGRLTGTPGVAMVTGGPSHVNVIGALFAALAAESPTSTATLGQDIAKAMRIAAEGRPGPVHISLPSDLLDAEIETDTILWPKTSVAVEPDLAPAIADGILVAMASAQKPIVFAPPQLSNTAGRQLLADLESVTKVPFALLESPRGVADAGLGAFPDVIRQVDLVVLLGKALDFTTRWAAAPDYSSDVKVIAIDPEAALVERALRETGERMIIRLSA